MHLFFLRATHLIYLMNQLALLPKPVWALKHGKHSNVHDSRYYRIRVGDLLKVKEIWQS